MELEISRTLVQEMEEHILQNEMSRRIIYPSICNRPKSWHANPTSRWPSKSRKRTNSLQLEMSRTLVQEMEEGILQHETPKANHLTNY
jgi:hypothetical protein